MSSNKLRLCFIGFGEAGQAIASGLREAGVESIAAWDILFPEDRGAMLKEVGEQMGWQIRRPMRWRTRTSLSRR